MRRRIRVALAGAAAVTLVVPLASTTTLASWRTTSSLVGGVASASSDCTTSGVYTSTASAQGVSGSMGSTSFSNAPALKATSALSAFGAATFTGDALPQGDDDASRSVSSGDVRAAVESATDAVLPLSPAGGALMQYVRTRSSGVASAAAGDVTSFGSPGRGAPFGTLDLRALLDDAGDGSAAAPTFQSLGLDIGSLASRATLDECARRWSTPLTQALTRSVAVSDLALRVKDSASTAFLTSAAAQTAAMTAALNSVTGDSSGLTPSESAVQAAAASALQNTLATASANLGLRALLTGPSGSLLSSSASVAITADLRPLSAAGSAAAHDASGLVTLDGGTGVLTLDLRRATGTNSPAPNTDLLGIGSGTLTGATVAATAAYADAERGAWAAVERQTAVSVTATASVAGLVRITTTASGTLADFASHNETIGALSVDVLGPLGISPSTLRAALTSLLPSLFVPQLEAAVVSAPSAPTTVLDLARATAENALAIASSTASQDLPVHLASLGNTLALTGNEQFDSGPSSGSPREVYGTTALHVRLRVGTADALQLYLARVQVGPAFTRNS